MLELYTHPQSPCAQKCRIVLAEKNLDWVAHHIDLPNKQNLTAEYLKLNPLGVVPTLVHEGRAIIESSIICEYLEDSFPQPSLRPALAWQVAGMRLWMKHIDNKLHPSCGALQWPLLMRPGLMKLPAEERENLLARIPEKPRRERQRRLVELGLDAPDVADAVQAYVATIADMEQKLAAGDWLAGPEFSLADAAMAPYFQTLYQFGWVGLYASSRNVNEWYSRVSQRPSYQKAVSADFPDSVMQRLRKLGAGAWPSISKHL